MDRNSGEGPDADMGLWDLTFRRGRGAGARPDRQTHTELEPERVEHTDGARQVEDRPAGRLLSRSMLTSLQRCRAAVHHQVLSL
jgi:hypothetical protein